MDRSLPPAFKNSLDFNLPTPERVILSKSTELIYLPSKLTEAVKIEFVFKAGKLFEPKAGVAQFATYLLDKGIAGKTSQEIASTFDYYGAYIESHAGFDYASIGLYCLNKHLENLLPLFLSIISDPAYADTEFETYQRLYSENLKVNLQKNSFIASNEIRKVLFGNHSYGASVTLNDIAKVTNEHVKTFYYQSFSPFKIFVLGSLDDTHLKLLSDWRYPVNNIGDSKTNNLVTLERTRKDVTGHNNTQASIRIGKSAVNRTHPDIAGIILANHLLGGFFGSRLMKNIREEKGLTYGIHSGIHHLKLGSYFSISADVNSDKIEIALDEILKEIKLMGNSLYVDEISLAKNHLIGSLQSDNASIFSVGERVKSIVLNELPNDYYKILISRIAEATPKYISDLTELHLSALSLSVIVVK